MGFNENAKKRHIKKNLEQQYFSERLPVLNGQKNIDWQFGKSNQQIVQLPKLKISYGRINSINIPTV